MPTRTIPSSNYVTSNLNGAISAGSTSFTIGTGLSIPAANGTLEINYDSTIAVGTTDGPESVKYTAYNSVTGEVTGVTRGDSGTTAVAHSNTASVAAAPSAAAIRGIQDGSNFETGTTAVGIPAAASKQEAWTTWAPTYTGSGSLTYGTVTTTYAKYIRRGNDVIFQLQATGTTGGVASNGIRFTLPVTAAGTSGCFAAYVDDGGATGGNADFFSTSIVQVIKYNASNFGLGAGRIIKCSGIYEAA